MKHQESDVLTSVVNCIAVATRYPDELLTPEADLELDLGIDSVKRVEIVAALADEFDLSLSEDDAAVRTIAEVAQWVEAKLANTGQAGGRELDRRPARESTFRAESGRPASVPSPARWSRFGANRRGLAERGTGAGENEQSDSVPTVLPHMPLQDKVVLVTGSGRGVGKVTARYLASLGAHVLVNSFHSREDGQRTAEEISAAGGQATHLWGSVANPEHVDQMFEQISAQFGRLDVLVCNASDGRLGDFLRLNRDDWDRAFHTNVSGHYQCALHAAELMHGRGGAIVTLSAVGAHQFIAGLGSQGVVKAAVESMTKYLACSLGSHGIRVNCVCGGPVYGELVDQFPDARHTQSHWESITADGQLCDPIDLARTIAFLASDQASGVHGAIWSVDHGFAAQLDGRSLRTETVAKFATSAAR